MKNIFAIIAVVISTAFTMSAQTLADGQVEAQNVRLGKVSETVSVDFDLDVSGLLASGEQGPRAHTCNSRNIRHFETPINRSARETTSPLLAEKR